MFNFVHGHFPLHLLSPLLLNILSFHNLCTASFYQYLQVLDVLRTVEVASTLGPEALGAYVISQATSASDVLAVMLLQKQFGMTPQSGKMMRVVPLFETLQDLTNAPEVVQTLFSLPGYLGAVRLVETRGDKLGLD
jgi:phosphoenolpyruvate carboxylase